MCIIATKCEKLCITECVSTWAETQIGYEYITFVLWENPGETESNRKRQNVEVPINVPQEHPGASLPLVC